jgi:hypothetical protein
MATTHASNPSQISIPRDSPVTGRISFSIQEDERENWFRVWLPIIQAAKAHPACVATEVIETRGLALGLTILTHWTTCRAFDAFIRESSVLWRERAFKERHGHARFDVVRISLP